MDLIALRTAYHTMIMIMGTIHATSLMEQKYVGTAGRMRPIIVEMVSCTKCDSLFFVFLVACRLVCQSPGGVCSSDGVCQCNPNWLGDKCHIPQCSEGCHPQGGYCDEPEECLCRNNWNGTFCNESSCTVNCSSIGGQCLEPDACSCLPGYTGDACEIGKWILWEFYFY